MNLAGVLMDFTFKTNLNDLVLGAVGPFGLCTDKNGLPHMRFLPTVFLLLIRCVAIYYAIFGTDLGINRKGDEWKNDYYKTYKDSPLQRSLTLNLISHR